jgi:hypothetical protein
MVPIKFKLNLIGTIAPTAHISSSRGLLHKSVTYHFVSLLTLCMYFLQKHKSDSITLFGALYTLNLLL